MSVSINFNFISFLSLLQTSYRGRKALNLGGVVSPRTKQSNQQASASPAPTVPQPSPNTATVQQSANQQQSNLIATQITAPQQQQQQQQTNIQQIPSSTAQTMKEQPQQPMVSFAILKQRILN